MAPIMPARARTPTTTPTAMPTLLGPPPPLELSELAGLAGLVTKTVSPALVTTAGVDEDPEVGEDAELDVELGAV